jgi:glycosyltransferase involved in cell wall biosynthesis
MKSPFITVNVLSYNRLRKLTYTVESILDTAGYDNWEFSVTDNGSQDGSVDFLKRKFDEKKIKRLVLLPKNYGEGQGARIGMEYAKGELLIHSCSDLHYEKQGWLKEVAEVMVAFPEVVALAHVFTKNYGGEHIIRDGLEIIKTNGVPAFSMAIWRKDYNAIDGFKDCGDVMGPKQIRHGKWGMEPLFAKEVRDLAQKQNKGTGCARTMRTAATHDWTKRGFRGEVYNFEKELKIKQGSYKRVGVKILEN